MSEDPLVTRATDDGREWLEADGLGGFASGTVDGIRARRYHALLLTATTPPTGRVALVQGFDAWVETASGSTAISSQRYADGTIHPDGMTRREAFDHEPWPTWVFGLPDGTRIRQEIVAPHERGLVIVRWLRLAGTGTATLVVRPFLSCRDYHATQHEHGTIRPGADVKPGVVRWQPEAGRPPIVSRANADYRHAPDWYRRFLYIAERERGLDAIEDLFAPGWLQWDLAAGPAVWLLGVDATALPIPHGDLAAVVDEALEGERRRRTRFPSTLHRAADAYLVRRGSGRTIVAGYPWFTDWGRDTFIALRGLCLATGRLDEAGAILFEWAASVSEGMIPNRFPDAGDAPEFNAVDASLWFVIAVQAFDEAMGRRGELTSGERARLGGAVRQIVHGYAGGTRYGIRLDADGLLACGVPGVQLTWMDAVVAGRVVTPRVGKPVEVQALWLNALAYASRSEPAWRDTFTRARAAFVERFWNDAAGCLFDVVDVDHEPGRVDGRVRPNQIFAVGGLPVALVDGPRARRAVDVVERRLWTPMGLRSLAPGEPGYRGRYEGGPDARDAAYHEGTAWPWLNGAFVDAWLHVYGNSVEARQEAFRRFVAPLHAHRTAAGLGHVSEVADGDAPHTPRGCPFQAWSVAELLRATALTSGGQGHAY